jgi:hypothetical protein
MGRLRPGYPNAQRTGGTEAAAGRVRRDRIPTAGRACRSGRLTVVGGLGIVATAWRIGRNTVREANMLTGAY